MQKVPENRNAYSVRSPWHSGVVLACLSKPWNKIIDNY
ncbi:hypothetical protein KUC_2680 [Vreelandella boliviensis LC1]|uniref:Uncharacterized protein n=1 Tax=Vreelandella boliviensis LC1 TaxID=1072583 RepID=A0A7U9GGG4_9GAMM|nr:hypothetical protein KUC_2680 [Halomonas boliviensis LC1]